jgi:hypothetical protein
MKQQQFDEMIWQRIAAFWAERGRIVDHDRVEPLAVWVKDLPRSHAALHSHVDTDGKK